MRNLPRAECSSACPICASPRLQQTDCVCLSGARPAEKVASNLPFQIIPRRPLHLHALSSQGRNGLWLDLLQATPAWMIQPAVPTPPARAIQQFGGVDREARCGRVCLRGERVAPVCCWCGGGAPSCKATLGTVVNSPSGGGEVGAVCVLVGGQQRGGGRRLLALVRGGVAEGAARGDRGGHSLGRGAGGRETRMPDACGTG